MSKRILASALVVAATAIGSVTIEPAPAYADTATSIGSCSAGPFTANYSVTYDEANGQDYITYLSWDIGGPAGTHNNVEARVKEDNSLGHDKIYYSYISPDSIGPGDGVVDLNNKGVTVPTKERMYVEFKFVFDVPGDNDQRCTGHTRNV